MFEAAIPAGVRRADVTLLFALCVATVSPAHDEHARRGAPSHATALKCGQGDRAVLTTPRWRLHHPIVPVSRGRRGHRA